MTYAEPFAGGAGAAVGLLLDRVVPQIAINDLDIAIFSFWHSLVNDSDEFLAKFDETPVTIDEWHKQREIYRGGAASGTLDLGFATFFLNRTNRSGVLTGGVIGGLKQSGADLVDARYNRRELRLRLVAIAEVADCIAVTNLDGEDFIAGLSDDLTFLYADPPYVRKGSTLYMNHFDEAQHRSLSLSLAARPKLPWIVTYDDVPEVELMYDGLYQGTFVLPYSAHTAGSGKERLIASPVVGPVMQRLERPLESGSLRASS